MEGFDNLYQSYDLAVNTGYAQWSIGSYTNLTTGRGGAGKALVLGNATVSYAYNLNEGYWGTAIKAYEDITWNFIDSSTNSIQAQLYLNYVYGYIRLYGGNGAATLYTSVNNAINLNVFGFLEVHLKSDASAGVFEVQYNGSSIGSVTGVKTAYSSNNWWSAISTVGGSSGALIVDDMRLFDTTTGPGIYPCNSWGGDLRVADAYAISNSSVTWTPSTGSNYSTINNPGTQALGTTYNTTSTVNNEDTFNFQTLSSVISEIIAVQVKGAYQQTDAAAHTVEQLLHISGTDYPGSSHILSQGWQYFTDLYPINPHTGVSWTLSDVNALVAGYKALS
jgi:hypothetical protein